MQSSIDFPFNFFEFYLNKVIYEDLNKFYKGYENEYVGIQIKTIDKELHYVEILKDSYDEDESDYSVFTFEKQVDNKINKELLETIQFIELGFKNIFEDKSKVKIYADFLRTKIRDIENLKSFVDFPFLNKYVSKNELPRRRAIEVSSGKRFF